jgi:putative peptide zinc metalloprotease protein
VTSLIDGIASGAMPTRGMPQSAPEKVLAPLRDELVLEPGPSVRGAPTWTLYDPVTNKFYRIGWLEFEILSHWHLRTPEQIAAHIARHTTLDPQAEDVERFVQFLQNAELLRSVGEESTARLIGRKTGRRQRWYKWLVHHYLFVRIPLLRPDRFLTAALPYINWVYSRSFLIVTMLSGLLGLYLALRQWDVFAASLPWFFSLEGAALAGLALFASKVLHECGHGFTAKKFGCRVPTMGIALLVLAPVLYTDTSAAWRLKERSKRLAIGAAGVGAECCLAAYALLAWSFLPDGILRSVVFIWATTTWILTVVINMSPFMRFDGYYLFSDLINVPNLQERSFALARHKMRELLFDFSDPPPEPWPPNMRRILIGYAFATWLYRFMLFLGIALVVYHMFFKALGIVLFAIEIWWFILQPIMRELGEWMKRQKARPLNRRSALTIGILVVLVAAFFIPWQSTVRAPGLMAAQTRIRLFLEVPGRVAEVHVKPGEQVKEGEPLITFESPDITFKVKQAERSVASLDAQIQAAQQDPELRSRAQLLLQDLGGARAELAAARAEQERLLVRAPVSGSVLELAEPLRIGEWYKAGEQVALVADTSAIRVDAYVEEADLNRIIADGLGEFIPSDIASPRVPLHIVGIEEAALRTLPDPELASVNGGAVPTRIGANEAIVPEVPLYRVRLNSTEQAQIKRVSVGTVILEGKAASLAERLGRKVLSVIIRESGF